MRTPPSPQPSPVGATTQVDGSLTTHADRGDPVIGLIVDRGTSVKTR